MKNIYLVRHGEALDDINNTYGGWADDPLTQKGIDNAKELAVEIQRLNPKKLYSSPLQRAKVTAEIIGQHLNLEVEIIEELKERNRNGILTGMNKDLAREKHPELAIQVEDYFQTIEGAESYEDYKERLFAALHKIIALSNEDLLIVAHHGTFRLVMWNLLNRLDFLEAEHHALLCIEENNGKLTLKSARGIKYK